MVSDKTKNRKIADALYDDVNYDVAFLTSAVTIEVMLMFKEGNYDEWLDNVGYGHLQHEVVEVVDELMFGKDSEYIKGLVWVSRNVDKCLGEYFNTEHGTCFDWFFMTKGRKVFEEMLKDYKHCPKCNQKID